MVSLNLKSTSKGTNTKNIFCLGGGGNGKSHLINCTSKWLEKILRQPGDHPLKPYILILGPTGMSAILIGKIVH